MVFNALKTGAFVEDARTFAIRSEQTCYKNLRSCLFRAREVTKPDALTDEGGELLAPVDIGQQPIVSSSHQASGAVSPSQIIKVLPTPNADNKERCPLPTGHPRGHLGLHFHYLCYSRDLLNRALGILLALSLFSMFEICSNVTH